MLIAALALPDNTTHLTQPLDKGVFGPLKTYWNQCCQEFLRKHPGRVLTDFSFNQVFSKAWGRAMTIPNAAAAFKTTGVFPFDPSAIQTVDTVKYITESTGLGFIPLYSPAHPRRRSVASKSAPLSISVSRMNLKYITESTGLGFIPLYSPAHPRRRSVASKSAPLSISVSRMNLEDSLSDSSAVFDQCLQESSDEEPPPSSLPSNLLIGEYRPKESIISKFFPSRPEISHHVHTTKQMLKY